MALGFFFFYLMPKNVIPFGKLGLIMMLINAQFLFKHYLQEFGTHKNMQHSTYVLEANCFSGGSLLPKRGVLY